MSIPQALSAFLSYLKIEKGLAVGDDDDGLSRRVLGALLTWMSERRAPVCVVATANEIMRLPPEMVRKGRFDEIFAQEKSKPQDPALAIRNQALLELLYATGMRVSEIVNLRLEDLNLQASSAIVRGKGDKERIVPFGVAARDALQIYLRDARARLCGLRRSPLVFVDRSGTGLSRERVWRIVREAKLDGKASPHMLRHSCATHMVGNGADLRTVQTILGHADIATTQVYTHVAMDRLKSVYRAHHPRGKRRIVGEKERA